MNGSSSQPTFLDQLRERWPWWRIIGTVVALGLIFYSQLGELEEKQKQVEKKRQVELERSVQNLREDLRRDEEEGRYTGQALRKLLGEPVRPTPTRPTASHPSQSRPTPSRQAPRDFSAPDDSSQPPLSSGTMPHRSAAQPTATSRTIQATTEK
jgi:hypothetical protein